MLGSAHAGRCRPVALPTHQPSRCEIEAGAHPGGDPGAYRDYIVLFISSQLGQATRVELQDEVRHLSDHSPVRTINSWVGR